jgi:hypothetical protein
MNRHGPLGRAISQFGNPSGDAAAGERSLKVLHQQHVLTHFNCVGTIQ